MNITRHLALAVFLTTSTSIALAASKKGTTPSDMVGKWNWTSISATSYTDTTTGSTDSGTGMSTTLTFTKDGRYTFFFYMKVRTYNVLTEASTASQGTVTWSNGQFTLHPVKGHYTGSYAGKRKTDRDMTAAERKKNTQWYYKWDNKDGKRALMMGMSPNILSHYKRDK